MALISSTDSSSVINSHKLSGARSQSRSEVMADSSKQEEVASLYFHSRKNVTIIDDKLKDGVYHRKKVTEEHIVIIVEPGYNF